MNKILCAGALALAVLGFAPVFSGVAHAIEGDTYSSGSPAAINLHRIKSALRLTSEQQSHWPPVEAALADIAREQAGPSQASNYISRIKRGIVGISLDSSALMRLAQAARPLLATLDDRQRQAARAIAREMGLGAMVSAMN